MGRKRRTMGKEREAETDKKARVVCSGRSKLGRVQQENKKGAAEKLLLDRRKGIRKTGEKAREPFSCNYILKSPTM